MILKPKILTASKTLLYIDHNIHKNYYSTASREIERNNFAFRDNDKELCKATNELWTITEADGITTAAPTYERLLHDRNVGVPHLLSTLQWRKDFPRHSISLCLGHYAMTEQQANDPGWLEFCFDFYDFESEEARSACLENKEFWTLTWCPDTPVGSYAVAAQTLESVLIFAQT